MTCFEDLVPHFYDSVRDYTYDNANQLLRIDRPDNTFTTFSYDNNGNLIEENRYDNQGVLSENRSYFYDFDDRLWKVEISKGKSEVRTVVEYEYDALGNRPKHY